MPRVHAPINSLVFVPIAGSKIRATHSAPLPRILAARLVSSRSVDGQRMVDD
eukprot:COSAG02_NODE_49879_length_324_cov_0.684444_1_plen_51_part_10